MSIEKLFLKWMGKLEYLKMPTSCGLADRRRLLCFILTSFAEMLYIPANLFGLNDYLHPLTFDVFNWFQLIFLIGLQVAFWRNWLSISASLWVFFVEIAIKLSSESLYQAFVYGVQSPHVLGNFNIILILAVVALSVRLRRLAMVIVSLLTIDLAVVCSLGSFAFNVRILRIFFIGYLFIFFVLFYNSKFIAKGLRQPMHIKSEEKKALEMLASLNDEEKTKASSLIDRLTPESKERIRRNVSDHFKNEEIEQLMFAQLCPTLTKSEIDICKLILQGKTLKDICRILGKTESNITSQRSHIRKKLNMDKTEDLCGGLKIRILKIRGGNSGPPVLNTSGEESNIYNKV